jgi:NAD-dependent SIR2 family protein deacetylase
MNDKIITAECHNCESSYQINYTEEFVSQEYPEHCPFCGELIEEIEEEYIEDEDSEDDEEWN